jgi:hypothetical protein
MEQLRHTPDEKAEWNESYYFNFYDPTQEIGGFTRIGAKPNIEEGMGYLFLFYKGDILAFHHQQEITTVPDVPKSGPLEFLPEWQVLFSGHMQDTATGKPVQVALDLTYTPLNAEFSYLTCVTKEEFAVGQVVCENHYEQVGLMEGKIVIGAHPYSIRGFSERDHSWGERDWNAPQKWIYVTAHFDRNFAINIATMNLDGSHIDVGFIMDHGENIPVTSIHETTISEGENQMSFEFAVEDMKKNAYILRGNVLNTVRIPYKRQGRLSMLHENLSHFMCGENHGYGIAEYLIRMK